MEENSLKGLWLDANQQQKIEINMNQLTEGIHLRISVLEAQIKKRNTREIIVCILMILLFGWFLLIQPQILRKVGAAIIISNCVVIIFRLVYAGKTNSPEHFASELSNYLRASLQQVRKQIALLSTVLWWYLLPFFIGVLCFYYSYPVSLLHKGCYTLIVFVLYCYIYYLNRKAVIKQLRPLESSILKALEELGEETV